MNAKGVAASSWNYGSTIQVRHIASPLSDALVAEPDGDVAELRQQMKDAQFDHAPVMSSGVAIGLIAEPREDRSIREQMLPLTADLLVSADTPISDLITHLAERPFLFVLEGRRIAAFVTGADLGSAPARTHFYLLIATLEMQLHRYLSLRYEEPQHAVELLSSSRLEAFRRLEADLRAKDQFIDALSSVSIDDLLSIAGRTDPAICEEVAARGMSWRSAKRGVTDFRNDVMHPSRPLPTDVGRLVKIETKLQVLIRAVEAAARRHAGGDVFRTAEA